MHLTFLRPIFFVFNTKCCIFATDLKLYEDETGISFPPVRVLGSDGG